MIITRSLSRWHSFGSISNASTIDVVHERKDALSLGSVDRNEQHEDHEKRST